MIQREWRPIQEFTSYEINMDGLIRKRSNQIQIVTRENERGLETCQIFKDGKRYLRSVNALVKRAFPGHYL